PQGSSSSKRETQAVPDLLQNLGLTQDQEAVVGQLLKDLGLAPQGSSSSKRETQAVPDLLQNLGLTQDQQSVAGKLFKDIGLVTQTSSSIQPGTAISGTPDGL
ncbi:hypothetical protein E3P77_03127, partial [Wallemia ichthyophaga]